MKKLLSIILAAAMILSLIPSVFAEGDATEPIVYAFRYYEAGSSKPVNLKGIKDDLYSDYNGRNWMFHDMSQTTDDAYNAKVTNAESDLYKVAGINGRLMFKPQASDEWIALKIKVPAAGIYTVSCQIYQKESYNNRVYMSMFYKNAFNEGLTSNNKHLLESGINFSDGSGAKDISFDKVLYVNEENGAEFIYLIGNGSGTSDIAVNSITLEKVSDTLNLDAESINLKLGENESQPVTASLETKMPLGFLKPAYSIEDEAVATVNTNGVVTAVAVGKTTLTATIGDLTEEIQVTVTAPAAPEEDEQFTKEFGEGTYEIDENKAFTENTKATVNVYTATLGQTESDAKVEYVNRGEVFTVTADDKTSEGLTFLYWMKGLSDKKQILTRDKTLKFMPTVESSHIIAVYEPEDGATVSDESFYNANGQLLTDVNITVDGKMPPLPSMTAYGTASKWVQYGTNEEFEAGEDAPTENKMFVAKYADPTETYAIKVANGTGSGNYTYGKKVTCTAEVPKGKIFKCWTKTPEGSETEKIISLDEEYTFNAWESCTLTAVFADEEPVFTGKTFSIILSTMGVVDNNTAYMAEFVGLGNVVEKGIAFGNKRVAMTTGAAQFTVVNDTTETDVKGYAILSDGTVIYDK